MKRLQYLAAPLLVFHCLLCNATATEHGANLSVTVEVVAATPEINELNNGKVALLLAHTPGGEPRLISCRNLQTNEILFSDIGPEEGFKNRAPVPLWQKPVKVCGWQRNDNALFLRAELECRFRGGAAMTWVVELDRESSMIRLGVITTNKGKQPLNLDWYPVWEAAWSLPGNEVLLHYWEPLSFAPRTVEFRNDAHVSLGSRLHSSDAIEDGKNPYWIATSGNVQLFFGLEWCGGWKAELGKKTNGFHFRVYLPESETQLILAPGENIVGPSLLVTPVASGNHSVARAEWMKARELLAKRKYGGPGPSFPFSWNHWYAIRFNIDDKFLLKQLDALPQFGFDYFVVDAGWYKACGDWTPDPAKFPNGSFGQILKQVAGKGTKPGIWSCPQFVAPDIKTPPNLVIEDQPGFYRKFIHGMLVDYVRSDFGAYLEDHIAQLRGDFNIGWWKFDQDFFTANTRHGQMKNVVALQDALTSLRKTYPDLYIESCQSGGRMLNEITVLSAQTQWIRDGGNTGTAHARSNFSEALNALGFLPPWAVLRWINRPNENNQDDDEFTRMYCRSAMAGTWGMVADLSLIGDRQRNIILEEVERYRRLNNLKKSCLYDIYPPAEGQPAAGIVYLHGEKRQAGLLFLRWDQTGAFEFPVVINNIHPDIDYRVEFVDSGKSMTMAGSVLKENGLTLSFGKNSLSQLVFVDPIK